MSDENEQTKESHHSNLRKNYQNAKNNPNNIYYTPDYAMDYIYDAIKEFPRVWEPCCGEGHMVRYLENRGHTVIGTDISMGEEYNLWTYEPPKDSYDIIVTNPPFQKKKKTMLRLFELGKPFAILMPTVALDSNPLRKMLKKYGQYGILIPNRTINYIPADHKDAIAPPRHSRSFFHSSWYCYKIPSIQGFHI